MKQVHFSTISEYHQFAGRKAPEHPLFSISDTHTSPHNTANTRADNCIFSSDFYVISLKKVISGNIFYGKKKYDCQSGTMLFMAPE